MTRPGSIDQHVTPSGIRFVGEPALSLLYQMNAVAASPAADIDDVLFAAQLRVRPRTGTSAVDPLLQLIEQAVSLVRNGPGVVGRQTRFSDQAARFHSIAWETLSEPHRWLGELCWRRVHPAIAGVPITDHIVIEETGGNVVFTVFTWASGGPPAVRGLVGAGQARPPLLDAIARATRPAFHGKSAGPHVLGDAEIDGFVSGVLLDERREHPVVVITPLESGGYHVDPVQLAAEFLGVAQVYQIDRHPATFRLSDCLGDRRLSCFWGALRVYQPGFSCADDPRSHPLFLEERLTDPVERAGLVGSLAVAQRSRVPAAASVRARREAAAAPVAVAAPSAPREAQDVPAAERPADATPAAEAAIARALSEPLVQLAQQIAGLRETNTALMDEIVRLRTTGAVRMAATSHVERRLGQLERLLRDFMSPPPAGASPTAEEPPDDAPGLTLEAVVRQASTAHSDTLLILDSALRAAATSPYEDVDRVAVILDAMALVARRRQDGALGGSMRDAFRELGVDYRGGISGNTSGRHRDQYAVQLFSGIRVSCEEHIALGNSQDPRYCLRIYFTSKAAGEARFVIGHIGRHFEVASTT